MAALSSPVQEGVEPKLDMNGTEESESAVVPMKEPNEGRPGRPEEVLEGRAGAKENRNQSYTDPTQSGINVSPGLVAVRQRARERKTEKFTNLLHHLTIDLLQTSYYALQRKASPGVDGVTWKEYETGLDGRLVDLHSRVHRGAYQAQPPSLKLWRGGSTYRKPTADSGRSALRRWRIRSFSKPISIKADPVS